MRVGSKDTCPDRNEAAKPCAVSGFTETSVIPATPGAKSSAASSDTSRGGSAMGGGGALPATRTVAVAVETAPCSSATV